MNRKLRKKKLRRKLIICTIGLLLIPYIISFVQGKEENIPQSLLELKKKYPETKEFVEHYPEKKNQHATIDISQEVKQGEIPLFLQWDERWGYETYGNNFLALTGCGPTCLSMVVCGLTGENQWNPKKVAEFSENKGYYENGVGTSWNLMTEGAQELGITGVYGYAREDYILEHLSPNTPMICSMYPGDFTEKGHFIVLCGLDEKNRVLVHDPNSKKNSRQPWEIEKLIPQIRSLWLFGK